MKCSLLRKNWSEIGVDTKLIASRSERTILYLATSFQHFDGLHPGYIGEIISCRSGIGAGAANTPSSIIEMRSLLLGFRVPLKLIAWRRPKPVFYILTPGTAFNIRLHIRISQPANFLRRNIICRSCAASCFKLTPKYLLGRYHYLLQLVDRVSSPAVPVSIFLNIPKKRG